MSGKCLHKEKGKNWPPGDVHSEGEGREVWCGLEVEHERLQLLAHAERGEEVQEGEEKEMYCKIQVKRTYQTTGQIEV